MRSTKFRRHRPRQTVGNHPLPQAGAERRRRSDKLAREFCCYGIHCDNRVEPSKTPVYFILSLTHFYGVTPVYGGHQDRQTRYFCSDSCLAEWMEREAKFHRETAASASKEKW